MVLIIREWIVDLIWGQLIKNLANRSCASSSWPTSSEWADAAKDTPTTPATTNDKEDYIAQRFYNLTIPSKMCFLTTMNVTTMTKKTTKRQESCAKDTLPTPAPSSGRQMIVPIGNTTYQFLHKRWYLTTMSAMTTTTKKTTKSSEGTYRCRGWIKTYNVIT